MVETDESDQHLWQIYCLISLTVTSFFLHINALSSSFDDHQVHSGNNCHIIRIFYTEDLAGYLSFISKPKDMNLLSAWMKSISTLKSYHHLGNWKTFYCNHFAILLWLVASQTTMIQWCHVFFRQYDDKISVRW